MPKPRSNGPPKKKPKNKKPKRKNKSKSKKSKPIHQPSPRNQPFTPKINLHHNNSYPNILFTATHSISTNYRRSYIYNSIKNELDFFSNKRRDSVRKSRIKKILINTNIIPLHTEFRQSIISDDDLSDKEIKRKRKMNADWVKKCK